MAEPSKSGVAQEGAGSAADMQERDALQRAKEADESTCLKQAFRESNLKPERPDDGFFRSLDSSVKRNTATIKKLRALSEETRASLQEELKGVNLSKYLSEAVAAIVEAKLKTADIHAAVQVCSFLHIRYKHFIPELLESLLKVFAPLPKGAPEADDKGARLSKRRTALRLLTELLIAGVITYSGALVSTIKDLSKPDQAKDREAAQAGGTLLVAFLKQAKEPLNLQNAAKEGTGQFDPPILTDAERTSILGYLGGFYTAAEALLLAEHKALRSLEAENASIMNSKGELSEETAAAYEKQRKSYEQLLRTLSSLAELLERPPPSLPEDDTTRVSTDPAATAAPAGKEAAGPEPIWDDEDMRAFYEDLPDIRAFVPAVLLGEAEPKAEEASKADGEEATDGEAASSEKGSPDKKAGKEAPESEDKGLKNAQDNAALEALLQRLPKAGSRDLVDQIAVDVCYLNSKGTRKKLVRALFSVPRTALELVPYYARLAATLASVMRDIAPMLLAMLEEEFNFLLPKKDQSKIETKIRNVHFLGELAKFKLAPPSLIFTCLRAYLDDLSGSNIDAACHLLESCGRFLYRSPDTSVRMSNLLDVLMRLKNAKNLDARQSTMVDNAYFQCKPPDRPATVVKHRPPLQEYIRRLIYTDLSASTIETVLRQLRKLPWSECSAYVAKVLGRVHKLQYANIHLVASLAAGFTKFHDDLPVTLVDQILEEIRVGLDDLSGGLTNHQRRVAQMRFLGELYNYRIVDSPIIFDTLYLLLNFGYGTSQEAQLDPPTNVFRIRLVLTLLETCGQFFDRGAAKRRLDRFLLYFQQYILSKEAIPLDVEFDLQDSLAALRPKLIRLSRLDMAMQAVAQQEEQEAAIAQDEALQQKTPSGEKKPKSRKKTIASRIADGTVNIVEGGSRSEWAEGEESESDDGSGSERGGDKEDKNEGKAASDTEEEMIQGGEDNDGDEYVRMKPRTVSAEDEAEFDKELRAMMQESIDARKFEVRKGMELAMPANIGAQKSGEGPLRSESRDSSGGMAFRLVTRRGPKQQTRELIVPSDSRLAISSRQKDDAEREEKQALKRIVLNYEEAHNEELSGGAVRTGTKVLNKGGLLFSNSGTRGRGSARGGRSHAVVGRGEVRNRNPLTGDDE